MNIDQEELILKQVPAQKRCIDKLGERSLVAIEPKRSSIKVKEDPYRSDLDSIALFSWFANENVLVFTLLELGKETAVGQYDLCDLATPP